MHASAFGSDFARASQRRACLIATALLAAAMTSFAGEPAPAPPTTQPRPTLGGAQDTDPGERGTAFHALFGDYVDEAYKANAIRELARKQATYPNQAPGATPPSGVPVWRSIGPQSDRYINNDVTLRVVDSGRIRSILPDPANPDKVYLLTSGGGLWKTLNFSHRAPDWTVLTDALISTSGGSAALGRDSETLYLGIGDPYDVLTTVAGVVVKSVDGGKTWSAMINLPGATSIRDLKVDTSGPTDVVFVATDAGLFISNDGGQNYALSSVGQAAGQNTAWSLVRSSTGWLLATTPTEFLTGADGAVGALYVSSDRGATWSPVPDGRAALGAIGRATLALASPGEPVVYAIASDPTGFAQGDVFRSIDGGLNWSPLGLPAKLPANPNCFQADMNILGDQAWYNQLIVVSPADAARGTVYIGGNLSTAKTSDGGTSWTLASSWLPRACDGTTPTLPYVHADAHAASIVMERGRERIVFGTDGGIFVSYDGGQSFASEKNKGIVSLLAQTIISSPRRSESTIVGLQDTGTRSRQGSSTNWDQVLGGDGEGVGWSQANNAVTIGTVQFEFIARRHGLPASNGVPGLWEDGTNGIDFTNPDCFPFRTPIGTPSAATDPTGLVFYNTTGSRLYKTTDGARNWQQVVQFGSVDAPSCIIRPTWHGIGLHPSDSRFIALAGTSGHVLVSVNSGASWFNRSLDDLVPGWTGFNSAPAWSSNGLLYVASESPTPGAARLAVSANRGLTWKRVDTGLPDVAISDIAVDPRDSTGLTVYAATWIGVYLTRDGGTTWTLFGAGLPNVEATGLYLSPTENFLRAATYGRGVWEIDVPSVNRTR